MSATLLSVLRVLAGFGILLLAMLALMTMVGAFFWAAERIAGILDRADEPEESSPDGAA